MTNLFSMSNEAMKQRISETHSAHTETAFDVESLFIIVKSILKYSTKVAEEVAQVWQDQRPDLEMLQEKSTPKPDFSVPLCVLKQIACELSCMALGGDVEMTDKTTVSILKKLSKFPWVAKAVLTLAAFAMEFADSFLLSVLPQSVDQRLTKSLGTLKRVLTNHSELQKRRRAIVDLNYLIKRTLQVMETIFEWEKLSIYDPNGIPVLSKTVAAYWIIMTVVTCAAKVTILNSNEDKTFDVSPYTNKLDFIENTLKKQLEGYKRKKEEGDHYLKIVNVLKDPTNIVEVLKILFSSKDFTPQLIDGRTNSKEEIDVLDKKHVLLLITGLVTSEIEISSLKESIISVEMWTEIKEKYAQYKIVWVAIVEKWTLELEKSFKTLRSEMPCDYILTLDSVTSSVTFIKKEWRFKGQPMVVVMNPQGKVENLNALYLIRLWGMKAFPFRQDDEKRVLSEANWIVSVMNKIQPAKDLMADENNYIFFYGGKTNWAEAFKSKLELIVTDDIIKNKISIKWHDVGTNPKEAETFWRDVESMFLMNLNQKDQEADPDQITQEIQKLFSNRYHTEGWAVLAKGSVAKVAGEGQKFLEVLEKFDEWKQNVAKKDFDAAFKEFYSDIVKRSPHCCRLYIPIQAGKAPEHMKCAECDRTMEMFITYKCCINDE